MDRTRSWQSRLVMPLMRVKTRLSSHHDILKARCQFDAWQSTGRNHLIAKFKELSFTDLEINGVRGELVQARASSESPLIVYFHGGGFVSGSMATHRRLAVRLSWATKCRVLTFDYSLAPENPYPQALHDAIELLGYLCATPAFDTSKLIFGGDSAGGGLALATFHSLPTHQQSRVQCLILLSPWVDLAASASSTEKTPLGEVLLSNHQLKVWATIYSGQEALSHPSISPLCADHSALPPVLIQASTAETLYDQSQQLNKRIQSSGGQSEFQSWNHVPHVWHLFSHWLPEGKEAIKCIAQFVQSHSNQNHKLTE